MTYQEVLENARKTIGPNCKVCPVCNGLACKNTMPGPGSKAPGLGANVNYEGWQKIRLEMDTITDVKDPDTSIELFGRTFAMPVFTAPIGSIAMQYNPTDDVRDFNDKCIAACEAEGSAHFFGDGLKEDVQLRALQAGSAHSNACVPVLNPMNTEAIKAKLAQIAEYDPFAVSLVADSAGLPHLKKLGGSAGTKDVALIRELRECTKKPFIVKGIMSVKAAEKAVEAGADAIIVSNHGGRVLPYAPSTAEVLPEIVAAVGGKVKILVDGGLRTGYDVFKAIALGADGVLICRPVLISYYGGGEEGIRVYLQKIKAEFSDAMYMCGAKTVADVTPDMVRMPVSFI